MNTAEYIVKKLEELNVNEFFGLPGDYNFNLIYAVENNPNTNWVGCTNELNAGYAADGYARIRGYGALITAYGNSELSAINSIAGAMAENVPIFNIVGLPSTKNIENKTLIHHNFQEVCYENFLNAYKQVTAATAVLNRDNAKLEIDRLIKTMVKEKKPVYVAIPDDIAQMEISDRNVSYDWVSDKENLEEVSKIIADKINQSSKPVIIADVLIKRFDAELEFKEFAAKTEIPVSNFIMGNNVFDMDSKNYIGTYFGNLRNPITQKYIEETDCLIAVGAVYSDINASGQSLPYNINDHIAIYGNYAYVEGKLYDNVKMSELLEAVTKLTETKEIEFNKPNIGLKKYENSDTELNSSYIYSRLQEFIKDNDILVTETGTALYGCAQLKLPASVDFQAQALWSSAGWATPAALGICMAKPQSRVIMISGDSSHLHTAMEIGTMIKYGLKPIIIIINNGGSTTNRLISRSINDKLNDTIQINYSKFARIFDSDIWSTKVTTADDFDKALRVTQIMNKLCYIEVCIDKLDAAILAKDTAEAIKSKIENTKIPATNVNNVYNNIQEVTLVQTNQSDNYETVVHKAFKDEELYEDKEQS